MQLIGGLGGGGGVFLFSHIFRAEFFFTRLPFPPPPRPLFLRQHGGESTRSRANTENSRAHGKRQHRRLGLNKFIIERSLFIQMKAMILHFPYQF